MDACQRHMYRAALRAAQPAAGCAWLCAVRAGAAVAQRYANRSGAFDGRQARFHQLRFLAGGQGRHDLIGDHRQPALLQLRQARCGAAVKESKFIYIKRVLCACNRVCERHRTGGSAHFVDGEFAADGHPPRPGGDLQ